MAVTTNLGLTLIPNDDVNWGGTYRNDLTTLDTSLGTEHNINGTHKTINADALFVGGIPVGALDSGTVTSGSTTGFTSTGKVWGINQLANTMVTVLSSLGVEKRLELVISNTIDSVVFASGTAVVAGDTFAFRGVGSNTIAQAMVTGSEKAFVGNITRPMTELTGKRWDAANSFEGKYSGAVTSTRATTATRVNPLTGLIESIAIDTPRIERGASGEVMIKHEGAAATNLFKYSDPTVALHGGSISNFTDNAIGLGLLVNGLQAPATTTAAWVYQPVTVPAGAATISWYVVMDDGSAPVVGPATSGNDFALYAENTILGAADRVELISGTLYRVAKTFTGTGAALNSGIFRGVGHSGKGFTVTGRQIETGYAASSYIPTTTTAVTRGADALSLLLADNFLRNDYACTHILDFDFAAIDSSAIQTILVLGASSADYHQIRINTIGELEVRLGDTLLNPTTLTSNVPYRLVVTKNAGNSVQIYLNSVLVYSGSGYIFTANYTGSAVFGLLFNGHLSYRYIDAQITSTEALAV